MNEKTTRATELEASADGDLALLARYGFSDLPEVFAMRDGNEIIQERSPCYRCVADGFYGEGTSGTWYAEGSIIVLERVPNQYVEPLNRAAGLRWAKWATSLPQGRVFYGIEDMAEAATMLAKDPRVTDLNPIAYQKGLISLCEEIKLRRDGKDARSLPGMSHNFAPQSGQGSASPILGAKVAQMNERGPGHLHGPNPGQSRGARRAGATSPVTSPLGGNPPTP
jgi:hypothetical protein